jgi:osmotically-inducible protein OsmY
MRQPAVRPILLSLTILGGSLLTGCAAVVVGGAATGATVAHDRRTVGTVIEDKDIQLKALRLLHADDSIEQHSNIDITVYNLQVLLTGQAESADVVQRLSKRIARIPRVRKVIDEVSIGAEGTWSDATADAYLTSRVKLALFGVERPGFDPLRVKVVSSQGTVYLMGLLTPEEADAVTDRVRFISGVKKVVRLFEYL